jgi:hypothetical protein
MPYLGALVQVKTLLATALLSKIESGSKISEFAVTA